MKRLPMAAALVAVGLCAAAAQGKTNLSTAQEAEGRLVLQTARNLVSYGESRGDALALITAAKLMASVPGRVLADGEARQDSPNFDIEGILKKAEDLSQGDPLVAKVVGEVRAAAEANSKAVCYWERYCYNYGSCEYAYACW